MPGWTRDQFTRNEGSHPMNVQLTLDQMRRPLPDLTREQWHAIYVQAAKAATRFNGRRYYHDDEGHVVITQWHPDSKYNPSGVTLWGVRRTQPYGTSGNETVEQWFERIDGNRRNEVGSYVAAWLLPLTQLAQLAGVQPLTR